MNTEIATKHIHVIWFENQFIHAYENGEDKIRHWYYRRSSYLQNRFSKSYFPLSVQSSFCVNHVHLISSVELLLTCVHVSIISRPFTVSDDSKNVIQKYKIITMGYTTAILPPPPKKNIPPFQRRPAKFEWHNEE